MDSNECKQQVSDEVNIAKTADALSRLSFAIVSHVAFTGHAQELENFLKKRSSKLMFIRHPFSYATQKKSRATICEKGILKVDVEFPQVRGPEILLYLKDILVTFFFFLKFRSRFHVYVGVDPLNAFVGLLLKRLGFVNVVIFYVIDYVPVRFRNSVLNNLYHSIDQVCVCHANYTWNLTSAMADARERRGINKKETHQMVVPTGTHFEKNKQLPFDKIDRTRIAFLSHLRECQGIELILEALPEIVKEVPSAKLTVIGTGPLEEYFKAEVKRRDLEGNVEFFGYIENHDEIEKIIAKCGVGLAPYVPVSNSFTWYADPGKPKVYLGCGVPVIITKVPEIAYEISKHGAGIAIKYDKTELTTAIVKLFKNEALHRQFRRNALDFASKNTWNKIFLRAFNQLIFLQTETKIKLC